MINCLMMIIKTLAKKTILLMKASNRIADIVDKVKA